LGTSKQQPELRVFSSVPYDAHWYSEALIPTAFGTRKHGNEPVESWTHADGVVGQFEIGKGAKGDFALLPNATCFIVIEAKMFSKLSPGVKNASFYNQGARNVACMAQALELAKLRIETIIPLGFYVLAPQAQIDGNVFSPLMTREHVRDTVRRRVDGYQRQKDAWFEESFLPMLNQIEIRTIAWETLVSEILSADPEYGAELKGFYEKCLEFNRPARASKTA
jgi:hypothetical protein